MNAKLKELLDGPNTAKYAWIVCAAMAGGSGLASATKDGPSWIVIFDAFLLGLAVQGILVTRVIAAYRESVKLLDGLLRSAMAVQAGEIAAELARLHHGEQPTESRRLH